MVDAVAESMAPVAVDAVAESMAPVAADLVAATATQSTIVEGAPGLKVPMPAGEPDPVAMAPTLVSGIAAASVPAAISRHVPLRTGATNGSPNEGPGGVGENLGCTAPQLRRFIKSRAYVPMHELRRRFGIEGGDDDVTGVAVDRDHRVFVGLPNREGHLLGELFRAGDVGYELSLDPISPIVIGVFPMRPIARG